MLSINADRNTNELVSLRGVFVRRVLEKTASSARLELFVSGESDYFDGHFPSCKILPALAQVELAIRLSSYYLGTGVRVTGGKRLKFVNVISADFAVCLDLVYTAEKSPSKKRSLAFKITSPDAAVVYSTGVLELEAQP
jgi:3-hydroxymyristoyl/3-hydroxydecanoyl-(acyl carrier protein) dehydratase